MVNFYIIRRLMRGEAMPVKANAAVGRENHNGGDLSR